MTSSGVIVFYRLASDEDATARSFRPPALRAHVWQPTWRSIRPPQVTGARWLVWWLMHRLHLFANRDYAVLVLVDEAGTLVHRSGVFPRWFRYPFMDSRDLQIGDVWTAPGWRGQGLAAWAISTIVAHQASPGRQFWYLSEAGNDASVRAIEKAGFHLFGEGRRISRLRLRALGQFVLQ